MRQTIHAQAALEFVRTHGVVLATARGSAPRLLDAITGEPTAPNWWTHPRADVIYRILAAVSDSEDVLVCRLLRGKITFVHRRLWPALVRVAGRFDAAQLAQVRQEHTATGRHVNREVAFPTWVPALIQQQAASLSEDQALAALGHGVAGARLTPKPQRVDR